MSVNVNLNEVQVKVEEKANDAKRLGRKMALAALGFAGLTYDAGKSVIHSADDFVNRAEKRGAEIEALLEARVSEVQEQMTEEAKAQRAKVEATLSGITEGVGDTGATIQEKFQSGLSALKIGSGTVIETDDIKIEVEIVDSEEPWDGYGELNAQEILDRLADLKADRLVILREYEANTKNRVTVLREIDMLLAGLETDSESDTEAGE
jgi:hypothetical protein